MSENCQKIEGGYGLVTRNPLTFWSGRPDSNRRRPAWEAGILPLNYGRSPPPILLLSCQTRARGRGTRAGPRVGARAVRSARPVFRVLRRFRLSIGAR